MVNKTYKQKRIEHHLMIISGEGDNTLKLTLIQKIKMKINGQIYLEHRTRPGWKRSLPFYAFKCPVHGIVIDYAHGLEDYLACPKCWEEKYGNMKPEK